MALERAVSRARTGSTVMFSVPAFSALIAGQGTRMAVTIEIESERHHQPYRAIRRASGEARDGKTTGWAKTQQATPDNPARRLSNPLTQVSWLAGLSFVWPSQWRFAQWPE